MIICSQFALITFKNFVINKGALGFLQLPVEKVALKEIFQEHDLLPSD